jgi:hypothetical protein
MVDFVKSIRRENRILVIKLMIARRRVQNAKLAQELAMNPPVEQKPFFLLPFLVPDLIVNKYFCHRKINLIRSPENSVSKLGVCIFCANTEIRFVNIF